MYIQKYLLNNQNGIPDYSKLNQKAKAKAQKDYSYMAQAKEKEKKKKKKKGGVAKYNFPSPCSILHT